LVAQEGFRGFWRGATLPILTYYCCTQLNLAIQKNISKDCPNFMIAKYLQVDSDYQDYFESLQNDQLPTISE